MSHPGLDYAGSGLANRDVTPVRAARPAGLPGLDVSSWQGNVDWATVAANGARFAYVKATEGTSYVNPYFTQQYGGAYDVGLVRGAYHFGLPDRSTGAAQAQWFADARRRVVGRRPDAARRARHRVQPVRRHVLRPEPERDGRVADELRHAVPGADDSLARHLHDDELVADLHRQLRRASARPSRSGSRAGARRPASFPPAGAATRSGSGRTSRSTSRATRTSSTGRRTTSSRSRTAASRRLRNLRRHRFLRRHLRRRRRRSSAASRG